MSETLSFVWDGGSVITGDAGVQIWVHRPGGDPVAVLEPRATSVEPGKDLRTEGLWLCITEESPGHWSVGCEAFGLELEDPDDAFGIPVPVGLDLEWEDDPTADDCLVTGEVLVGDQRIEVNGRGRRQRST